MQQCIEKNPIKNYYIFPEVDLSFVKIFLKIKAFYLKFTHWNLNRKLKKKQKK